MARRSVPMSMTFCVSRAGHYLIASDRRWVGKNLTTRRELVASDVGGKLIRVGDTWMAFSGRPCHMLPVMEQLETAADDRAALWRVLTNAPHAFRDRKSTLFHLAIADRTGVGRVSNVGAEEPTDNRAFASPPPGRHNIVADIDAVYDALPELYHGPAVVRVICALFARAARMSPLVSPSIDMVIDGRWYLTGMAEDLARMPDAELAAALEDPPAALGDLPGAIARLQAARRGDFGSLLRGPRGYRATSMFV
jgi:hypothetical protein